MAREFYVYLQFRRLLVSASGVMLRPLIAEACDHIKHMLLILNLLQPLPTRCHRNVLAGAT